MGRSLKRLKCLLILTALFGALAGGQSAHAAFTFAYDAASIQTINFGTMDPGTANFDVPPSGQLLQLNCTSDQGLAYTVQINNTQPLTHTTDAAFSISNDNFKWFGTFTTGAGTLTNQSTSFSTTPQALYSGVAADANGATIVVQMKFGLIVPSTGIRAGTYRSTIQFTMTE